MIDLFKNRIGQFHSVDFPSSLAGEGPVGWYPSPVSGQRK